MLTRQRLIYAAAGVVFCLTLAYWLFGGDGRVTLNYENAPVGKVLKSIERQAGITIVSNIDPAKTVTVHLTRAKFTEALDTVATRVDGDYRLAYIAAPTGQKIKEGLAGYASNAASAGWIAFGSRGWGGGGGGPMGGVDGNADPRVLEWKLSDATDRSLQAFLSQGAQKTGAMFAVPSDWNPVLGGLPTGGETRKMAKALASAAKGSVEEVFLVSARPQRGGEDGPPDRSAGGGGGQPQFEFFASQRGNNNNPAWMAERAQAQIAQLPEDERAQAQAQFDAMRALWASTQNLSQDERRAKMEEFFNKPEVQDMMEQRAAARDAKNTPEQRESRYRSYIQRKMAATGGAAKS